MIVTTTADVIKAAASVGRDVAEGKIDPAVLDQAVADECRELFGTVVGEGDPLWPLHIDVARQVLADGGLSTDELSEWLAVARSRAGEPVGSPQPPIDPMPAAPPTSGPLSAEIDVAELDLSDDARPEPEPDPAAKAGNGCVTTEPKMVDLPNGRRVPSRLIIARGRGLPDPGYGPM